jgi:hypothetical protein
MKTYTGDGNTGALDRRKRNFRGPFCWALLGSLTALGCSDDATPAPMSTTSIMELDVEPPALQPPNAEPSAKPPNADPPSAEPVSEQPTLELPISEQPTAEQPTPGVEMPSPAPVGKLVIVSERESAEAALQYLHVLDGWPESKTLDYSQAIELPEFPSVFVQGSAVYVHVPDTGRVTKFVLDAGGQLRQDAEISFETYGAAGFDAELIFAADDRAYLVDEASAQIIAWNPASMTISASTDVDEAVLERDGLPVQFQQGVSSAGRAFTAVNWRNWDTYEYRPAAAIGFFDATVNQPSLQVLEDERCAPSVALSPFVGEGGDVYLVSDAALGFDAIANENATTQPLCVLRIKPGATTFDPDFFVDLRAATGSPGFYTAHPMAGSRLLVNVWSPAVAIADVATPGDPSWYWESPYFEYVIVDLATGTSIPVPGLARAAVQFSKTLRVDGLNYVQLYRDDRGSDLNRVDPDGTVTPVLNNGSGTDVQFIGRLAPAQ